jgi:hypothetical protein
MGLYDTFLLEPSLTCPRCGKEHVSIQSKQFDSTMSTYRPGMFVRGCPVHTGILKEWTTCCAGPERLSGGQPDDSLDVWIVIWHGIYSGHALDAAAAKRKMDSIDRLDLLDWLDRMQQESREWKSRYHAMRHDIGLYLEYRDLPPEDRAELDDEKTTSGEADVEPRETRKRRGLHLMPLHFLDKSIRTSADPLRSIYDKHEPDHPADHGLFGWD